MTKEVSITRGDPIPKSVGRCADEYAEVRELRLAMQKEVDTVQKRESELREFIIENLSSGDDTGAAGLKYRAQIKIDIKPTVKDWDKVFDFIVENDRFDLLQKRVSDKAIKEIWGENETVPGIEKINVKTVSITKI